MMPPFVWTDFIMPPRGPGQQAAFKLVPVQHSSLSIARQRYSSKLARISHKMLYPYKNARSQEV
jgi:hypothetical protein